MTNKANLRYMPGSRLFPVASLRRHCVASANRLKPDNINLTKTDLNFK